MLHEKCFGTESKLNILTIKLSQVKNFPGSNASTLPIFFCQFIEGGPFVVLFSWHPNHDSEQQHRRLQSLESTA